MEDVFRHEHTAPKHYCSTAKGINHSNRVDNRPLTNFTKICQEIAKCQYTIAAASNPPNKVECRVDEALEMLADQIAKVNIKGVDQMKIVGDKLSDEMQNIGAALSNRIENLSKQCSQMEINSSSVAQNTRPTPDNQMRAVHPGITSSAIEMV